MLNNSAGEECLDLSIESSALQPTTPPHRAFAALANDDFRIYFLCASAAMMADNIEHVISYFVLFQKFHSPALGGFAVIAHWVPFLVLAGYTGALADRFDIRRLIQVGMLLFIGVSVSWGLMFLSDSVALWKAQALLVVHGLAGVIWLPAGQVLINRLVLPDQLASAVRLNATGRYLGFVAGPLIGAGLLLMLGPTRAIWVNALIYVPLFAWLLRFPAGKLHAAARSASRVAGRFAEIWASIRVVARSPVLLSMTVLVGAASCLIGNAYQAQMPGFAFDLGHGRADLSYGLLLGADAAGGLAGGLILESRGLLPPRPDSVFMLAAIWCIALLVFALSHSYLLSMAVLFAAGFAELAFNAMAQTLVQMNAPDEIRGGVIGVFSMAALGLRTFSGVSVGLLGASLGIHESLALSAGTLFAIYAGVYLVRWSSR
jgi:MFS family permease